MRLIFLVIFGGIISLGLHSSSSNIAKDSMVTTATKEATSVGVKILQQGGNAADATVAVAFALSVTEPYSAGIGGGGFLLYRDNKSNKILSLDFRERAPIKATKNMFIDEKRSSINGHFSVAVPHTVQGLFEFHKRFGKTPWAKLVEPAIKLAQEGIPVTLLLSQKIAKRQDILRKYPDSRKIFLPNNKSLSVGEKLTQKDLAQTLRRIAKDHNDFYTGVTAKLLISEFKKHGGLLQAEDLKNRKVTWRDPVCSEFLGTKVCSMGPPSSGGIILAQVLKILQKQPFTGEPWHSTKSLHMLIETMRVTYADRAALLGDPDFVSISTKKLLSPNFISQKIKNINLTRATPSKLLKNYSNPETRAILNRYESNQTTHFNIVDKDRNAVAVTFTINGNFGSGVVAQNTGILLNNEMDDFAKAVGKPNLYGLVGGTANRIAPGKIPLSSMTPIIAERNKKLVFLAGSPGGSTIITTGIQITLNILLYNMSSYQAVSQPRIHMQWLPDKVFFEKFSLDETTKQALEKIGHNFMARNSWGNASVILVRPDKLLEGATDPRGQGLSLGYTKQQAKTSKLVRLPVAPVK